MADVQVTRNMATVRYSTRPPYFSKASSLVELATERDSTQIKIQQVHPVSRYGSVLAAKQASEGEGNHDSRTHQGCNHTRLDAS